MPVIAASVSIDNTAENHLCIKLRETLDTGEKRRIPHSCGNEIAKTKLRHEKMHLAVYFRAEQLMKLLSRKSQYGQVQYLNLSSIHK